MKFLDPPQLEDPDIKKEKDGVIQNGQGTKLTDQYLSASDGFANQDPDELMTNEKNSKELKDIEDGNLQDASGGVKVYLQVKYLLYTGCATVLELASYS